MLIIEKNAVYEVDCECLQKKTGALCQFNM